MKHFILRVLTGIAAFLLFNLSGNAQWKAGVTVGGSCNTLETSSGYFYDRTYHAAGGYAFGAVVQREFKDWLAVGGEVNLLQKNYKMERSGFFKALQEQVKNTYLDVPVYAQFSFGGKRLRGFVNLGMYTGVWLGSRRKGKTYSWFSESSSDNIQGIEDFFELYAYNEKVSFDSRRDNRFDWGMLAGAGLRYRVAGRWELAAECRYYRGLGDLQKDYMKGQIPRYNDTFAFTVGVMYCFGKN